MKYKNQKRIILFLALLALTCSLHALTTYPAGNFWSLDAGIGMSNVLVDGHSYQIVIDPKLWLSPPLTVGSRLGILAAYRGWENPFDDVTRTRGSILADAGLGITIPLSPRWHIEPMVRDGYPHMFGPDIGTYNLGIDCVKEA